MIEKGILTQEEIDALLGPMDETAEIASEEALTNNRNKDEPLEDSSEKIIFENDK